MAISAFVAIAVGLGTTRFAINKGLPAVVDGTVTAMATLAPLIAAMTVAAWTQGRDGLRELLSRAIQWRIHPRWYVLGLAIPPIVYWTVLAGYVATGGPKPRFEASDLVIVPVILVAGLFFFMAEEIGWRGWLQRALQARANPLTVALLVGVVWVGWHVPLLVMPDTAQAEISPGAFGAIALPAAVVFAWIYNATGGSVLAVVAAHTGFNLGLGPAVLALPERANTFIFLCAAATTLLAAAIIIKTGSRLGFPQADTKHGHSRVRGSQDLVLQGRGVAKLSSSPSGVEEMEMTLPPLGVVRLSGRSPNSPCPTSSTVAPGLGDEVQLAGNPDKLVKPASSPPHRTQNPDR